PAPKPPDLPTTPDKPPDVPTPPDIVDAPKRPPEPEAPTAKIEFASVEGLLARLPESIRPWIPHGRVEFTGGFSDKEWKVTARFEGLRYEFPDPVGEL